MKNILLGIIAINLTFISANLYLRSVEPVQAQIGGMSYDLTIKAVKNALEECKTYSGKPRKGDYYKAPHEENYFLIRCR